MRRQMVYFKNYRREKKKKFSVFKFGILFMLGLVSLFMGSLVMFGVFMGMTTGYIFYRAWKNAKEYNEEWLEPPKPVEKIEKICTQAHYPTTCPTTNQLYAMNYYDYYEEDETKENFCYDLYEINKAHIFDT